MPYIADEWEPDAKAYELFLCHIHALELEEYEREKDFDARWVSYDCEDEPFDVGVDEWLAQMEEDVSDSNVALTDLF